MDDCNEQRWKAHYREHMLEKEALVMFRVLSSKSVEVAKIDIDRRLDEMNELRAQINHERGAYPTRVEYEAKYDQLVQRIQLMETTYAGLTGRLAILASLAGFAVSVVVTISLKLINI